MQFKSTIVRRGLTERVTSGDRLEGREGVNLDGTWRKSVPGRGHGKCKDLKTRVRLACSGNSKDEEWLE